MTIKNLDEILDIIDDFTLSTSRLITLQQINCKYVKYQ